MRRSRCPGTRRARRAPTTSRGAARSAPCGARAAPRTPTRRRRPPPPRAATRRGSPRRSSTSRNRRPALPSAISARARVVEQEERRRTAGRPGASTRPHLGEVVGRVGFEQVGEHARGENEVEARVVVGEPVLVGAVRALRVVAGVEDVGDLEAEVRMAPVAPPAPRDAVAVDVEAVVGAVAGQVAGERPRHPADAAADVEHALVGLQAAQLDEVAPGTRRRSRRSRCGPRSPGAVAA